MHNMYRKFYVMRSFRKLYKGMRKCKIFECSSVNQTKFKQNIMRDYADNISLNNKFIEIFTLSNMNSSAKCTFGCDVL